MNAQYLSIYFRRQKPDEKKARILAIIEHQQNYDIIMKRFEEIIKCVAPFANFIILVEQTAWKHIKKESNVNYVQTSPEDLNAINFEEKYINEAYTHYLFFQPSKQILPLIALLRHHKSKAIILEENSFLKTCSPVNIDEARTRGAAYMLAFRLILPTLQDTASWRCCGFLNAMESPVYMEDWEKMLTADSFIAPEPDSTFDCFEMFESAMEAFQNDFYPTIPGWLQKTEKIANKLLPKESKRRTYAHKIAKFAWHKFGHKFN